MDEAEAQHIVASSATVADKIRRLVFVAPTAMFLYCLLAKGALLDGIPGFIYASQRMVAETILSLFLLQGMLRASPGPAQALVEISDRCVVPFGGRGHPAAPAAQRQRESERSFQNSGDQHTRQSRHLCG